MKSSVDYMNYEDILREQNIELDEKEFFENSIKTWLENLTLKQVNSITPMQVMSKMNEYVSRNFGLFGEVVNIRGIFTAGNGTLYQNGYYYDNLKDENYTAFVKVLVRSTLRNRIKFDSLVVLRGMFVKKLKPDNSALEILFRVDSIVEEIKSKAISDEDLKRLELIQKKNEIGKKPVDSTLRNILMRNERPKIYIIYALGSITDKDFDKGVKSAGTQIDFTTDSVSFANTAALIYKIMETDKTGNYHAICLVRGGGSGMDKLDNISLLETLLHVKTPIIAGLGHVGEVYYIKSIVDADEGTPSLLGQYFDNLVKECAQEREGTINNLAQKIEEKYKPHMRRLSELEVISKADKAKIESMLAEKKKDIESYAKVNNELIELRSNLENRINSVKSRINGILIFWQILAIISLLALIATFYIYGQTQLWW